MEMVDLPYCNPFFDKNLTNFPNFNCYFSKYVRKYQCVSNISKSVFTEYRKRLISY